MAMQERGAERECQQQNEKDCRQSLVGDRLAIAVLGIGFGAMPACVQKVMLKAHYRLRVIGGEG